MKLFFQRLFCCWLFFLFCHFRIWRVAISCSFQPIQWIFCRRSSSHFWVCFFWRVWHRWSIFGFWGLSAWIFQWRWWISSWRRISWRVRIRLSWVRRVFWFCWLFWVRGVWGRPNRWVLGFPCLLSWWWPKRAPRCRFRQYIHGWIFSCAPRYDGGGNIIGSCPTEVSLFPFLGILREIRSLLGGI